MTTTILQRRPSVSAGADWAFPSASPWGIENGITGHHVEVPGCGLLDLRVQLQAPLSGEPAGRDGIAAVLASYLGEAGTADHDAIAFASEFEELGASFRGGFGDGGLELDLSLPASAAEQVIALLGELLLGVVFPEPDVKRIVDNGIQSYYAEMADPMARASHGFYQACFTPDSRLSRPPRGTPQTIAAIDHEQVAGYWASIAGPARLRVMSAGDRTMAQIQQLVTEAFGAWDAAVGPPAAAPEPLAQEPSIRLVDRPGSVQTAVLMGSVSVDQKHPAYPALTLASYALGGAMNSRLSRVLRDEKGYTYGVSAGVRPHLRVGVFEIRTMVDRDVTVPALLDITRTLAEFRDGGMSGREREDAVDGMVGTDPIRFQTPDALLDQLAGQASQDLPSNWLNDYRSALSATTAAASADAFRAHVPERLTTVLVGDATVLEAPLASNGCVAEVVEE